MFIKKFILRAAGTSLAALLSLAAQPLRAQESDADRLQKLEQAVKRVTNSSPFSVIVVAACANKDFRTLELC
jgi:hypothetical protein